MGCDIHMHCEYRSKSTDNEWFNCDLYRRNPYYNKDDPDGVEPKWSLVEAYDGRNYTLFGILAGVRGNYNDTIDSPRGVPGDISKQTRKEYCREFEWCHSFSWLRLDELIKYNDDHKYGTHGGMVSPESAKELDENGKTSNEWCRWTNNDDYVYREWQDKHTSVSGLLECLYERFDDVFGVYDFLSDAEKDQRRREYAKNARIIFWFDS